jgi:transcription initiation factor IIE alpha subunit
MKYKVGDIIRSKHDMIITNLNDDEEEVDKEQYFIVVSYGERKDYSDGVGHTILCQKSGSHSFWNEEFAPLNESFSKG